MIDKLLRYLESHIEKDLGRRVIDYQLTIAPDLHHLVDALIPLGVALARENIVHEYAEEI